MLPGKGSSILNPSVLFFRFQGLTTTRTEIRLPLPFPITLKNHTIWKCFLSWNPDWTDSTASAGQKARSVLLHGLTRLLQIPVSGDWLTTGLENLGPMVPGRTGTNYIDPDNFSCKFSSLWKPIPDVIPNWVYSYFSTFQLTNIVEFGRSIASVGLMLSLASASIHLILFFPLPCSLLSGWLWDPCGFEQKWRKVTLKYMVLAARPRSWLCLLHQSLISGRANILPSPCLSLKLLTPLCNHRI